MSTITSDAGTCLMIRGETEEEVELALRVREEHGYKRQAPPAKVGKAWIATCAKPGLESATAADCKIERLGIQAIVRGPTERAVREAVDNLAVGGARLLAPIELFGKDWTAICEAPR
jgi:hypothetical protein